MHLQTIIISPGKVIHKGPAPGDNRGPPDDDHDQRVLHGHRDLSVLGGILPLATVLNHTRLQVYLSFSASAMLAPRSLYDSGSRAGRIGRDGPLDRRGFAGAVFPGAVLLVPSHESKSRPKGSRR